MSSRNMGEFRFIRPGVDNASKAALDAARKLDVPCYAVMAKDGQQLGLVFNRYRRDPKPGRPYKMIESWHAYGVEGEFKTRRDAAEALATAKGKPHGERQD